MSKGGHQKGDEERKRKQNEDRALTHGTGWEIEARRQCAIGVIDGQTGDSWRQ